MGGRKSVSDIGRSHTHDHFAGKQTDGRHIRALDPVHDSIVTHREAEGLVIRENDHRQLPGRERKPSRLHRLRGGDSTPLPVFEVREDAAEVDAQVMIVRRGSRLGRLAILRQRGSGRAIGRQAPEMVGLKVAGQ